VRSSQTDLCGGTRLSRDFRTGRTGSFALYEIVLSVIVLTVLGCFAVRMLITAKNTNAKAYDLYKGVSHAISAVETVKGASHPNALVEGDFGPGYKVSLTDSEVKVTGCFDEEWNAVDSERADAEVCYYVRIRVFPSEYSYGFAEEFAQMYQIDVEVTRITPYVLEKNNVYQVFSMQAARCYSAFTR